ncbi:hypothetical protein Fleli_1151 [Bernardetia litoralis DSM 6794]|uniref:Uncharacterized protein n=1 Tax=Bernardetia litoralis (strain ATCC 23117 / DSM 6794 / NBRC 15988 / NCIMB 1366 / Fx l1 / Sio-4) TaxID=880071 RepID=I4AI04_BERLS|nr:hypothetical protein [Bernardetia litoralis]AFM03589.1 hypothetical protein Fleli_1151 [Bernardetia litoralis DSM 6794]
MLKQAIENQIDKLTLNDFQTNTWEILLSFLKRIDFEKISDRSYLNEGSILDVIIYLKNEGYTLNFSIKPNVFYINSQFYDIYLYSDDEKIKSLSLFLHELLKGNYSVENSYNQKDKIIKRKMLFDNNDLLKFNIEEWTSIFNKKIIKENAIRGINLMK